ERDLSLERQCGMTAGENQLQTVIGDFGCVVDRLFDGRVQRGDLRYDVLPVMREPPETIDRLVASCLDNPRARVIRDTGLSPLVNSGREGFLRGFLGHFEITHQMNERGDDTAPVGAVDFVDGLIGGAGHYRWYIIRRRGVDWASACSTHCGRNRDAIHAVD